MLAVEKDAEMKKYDRTRGYATQTI